MALGDDNGSRYVHEGQVFDNHVYAQHQSTDSTRSASATGATASIKCPADPTIASFYRSKKRQRCCDANESQISSVRRPMKRQRLAHEASEDDWYVVIDYTWNFKDLRSSNQPTLHRFSSALASGKRSLRCKASEARDLSAWIFWHQKPTSYLDVFSIETLLGPTTTVEFKETIYSECRSDFSRYLNTSASEDIPALLAAFYSITNARRVLSSIELTQAVQAILRQDYNTDVQLSTLEKYVSHLCSVRLLQYTENGINFANPAMSIFWKTVRLPEMADGHALFTRICFAQLRQLGLRTILQPWFNFQNFSDTYDDHSLAAYARQFWDSHYRQTETVASGIEIAHELAQMMCEALIDCPIAEVTILVRKEVLDASHGICDIYDFPVLSSILENMGADTTYGKERYLQSLATEKWSELEPGFSLRISGAVHEDFSANDTLLAPSHLSSMINELGTLDLTTSARLESPKCKMQRTTRSGNILIADDLVHVSDPSTNFSDAHLDQYCKHIHIAEMEDSGVWECLSTSDCSDDDDWEHIDNDALRGMG